MNDEKKTKAQLIEELKSLRKQLKANDSPMSAARLRMQNIKGTKEYLEAVVKTSRNLIVVLDSEGRFEFGNKSFFQIIGWSKKDLIGEFFMKIFPENLHEIMMERWQETLAGTLKPYEAEIVTKKGKRKLLYISYKEMVVGGQLKYCVVANDITESKQNELALKESEKRYRDLISNVPSVIWSSKAKGGDYFVSENIKSIYGYTREELIKGGNKLWHSNIHPDDFGRIKKSYCELMDEMKPLSIEYRLKRKDGKWIWVSDKVSVYNDENGDPYMIGTFSDITERKETQLALQESEKKYRELTGNLPSVLWRSNSDGSNYYVTPNIKDIYGYTPKEQYEGGQELWYSRIHPDDLERVKNAYITLWSHNGPPFYIEYRLHHKNGKFIWVSDKVSLRRNTDGSQSVYGIFSDVTERKEAQLALAQRESQYRSLVQKFHGIVFKGDADWKVTFMQGAVKEITGYSIKELRSGKVSWKDVIHPDDLEMVFKQGEKLMIDPNYSTERTYRIVHKNGKIRWINDNIDPTVDDAGNIIGVQGTIQDITEQKKAQDSIKNLLDFENLMTEISTSFINLPVERTDTGINIALGILSKFLAVDRSSVVLFSEDLSTANIVYEWCAKGIASRRAEITDFSTKDYRWWITRLKKGQPIYMHSLDEFPENASNEKEFFQSANVKSYVTTPIFFNKELIGFMNFYSIKAAKTWDQETLAMLKVVAEIFVNTIMRSRTQRELREYDAKMFRTEQLASLGIISANIAHELNQPLTVVQLLLQQVKRSLTKKIKDVSDVKENIDDSLSEIGRAAEIVGRFRTFARQSSASSIEKIDICKVAASLIKALSSGARKMSLKLSLEKPLNAVYVRATAADIEQLFFVLIQNSIQAANLKKKNRLDITISSKKNEILINFKDNCGGVDQDVADKIFEPFFTTKPRQQGTGLGLPILDRIVKRYEGSMKYENRPGFGISFHISLPLNH